MLVSFVWGIFIFEEPIHSQFGACVAILFMILGLFGMSYFSAPTTSTSSLVSTVHATDSMNAVTYEEVGTIIDDDEQDITIQAHLPYSDDRTKKRHSNESTHDEQTQSSDDTQNGMTATTESLPVHQNHVPLDLHDHELITHVHVWGQYKVSKRYLGMASAAFCGLYGGSIMAPMK